MNQQQVFTSFKNFVLFLRKGYFCAEAHASPGYRLVFYNWNFNEGKGKFKRAIELNHPADRMGIRSILQVNERFDKECVLTGATSLSLVALVNQRFILNPLADVRV